MEQLEGFRQDMPVRDSSGNLRAESAGGKTRFMFCKIPGNGLLAVGLFVCARTCMGR